MNPRNVERSRTRKLTDLPNVGPATARDLQLIGIQVPEDLRDCDPLQLYERLCQRTGVRQDPCVLDVYMSLTDYVDGGEPRPWWTYSDERKGRYGRILHDRRKR